MVLVWLKSVSVIMWNKLRNLLWILRYAVAWSGFDHIAIYEQFVFVKDAD